MLRSRFSVSSSRFSRRLSGGILFAIALAFGVVGAGSTAGCAGSPPPSVTSPKKADRPGPFGRLTLPPTARVVWIVYREDWRTDPNAEESTAGKVKPSLRRRDLVTIRVLVPDASGLVVPDAEPAVGTQHVADAATLVRAHAIVIAPGLEVIDWDSHAFGDTPTPPSAEPLDPAAMSNHVPEGCESAAALAAFFRDFAPGVNTGLSPAQFTAEARAVLAPLLRALASVTDDPDGSTEAMATPEGDSTATSTAVKEPPKCPAVGPRDQAVRDALVDLRGWVGTNAQAGDPSAPVPKPKLPSLATETADARWSIIIELWSQGAAAAPRLREALASNDSDLRLAGLVGAWGLAGAPSLVPDVLPLASSGTAKERAFAISALGHLGTPEPSAIPAILAAISNPGKPGKLGNDALDTWLISSFSTMGKPGAAAIGRLVALASDATLGDRRAVAARALYALGTLTADQSASIAPLLGVDDTTVADQATYLFEGVLKLAGKPAVPALINLLGDPRVAVRQRACRALLGIGKEAEAALPRLADAMHDDDAGVRLRAVTAVLSFEAKAAPYIDAIEAAARAKDETSIRCIALSKLPLVKGGDVKDARILKVLEDALGEGSPNIQSCSAIGLGLLGPAAAPALPALRARFLASPDDSVRRNVADAIASVGPKAAAEMPKLVEAVRATKPSWARTWLRSIGAKVGKGALPALRPLLTSTDDDSFVAAAIGSIGAMKKDGASEAPTLAKLAEKTGSVGNEALTALGAMGPAAGSAVAPLVAWVRAHPDRRWQFLRTLEQIGAPAVGPLTKILGDDKAPRELRVALPTTLLDIGAPAAPSTGAILEALEMLTPSDTWTPRLFAKVGKPAIAPLSKALEDPRAGIRKKAVIGLGALPEALAHDVVTPLLGVYKDASLWPLALEGIKHFGKPGRETLVSILADPKKKALHDAAEDALKKTL